MAKILLVDDDAELRKNLTSWLSMEHHAVETAENGRDGLEKLQFYEYDLAILDWNMPELEGVEVLRQYRAAGGKTPILMLTGKDAVNDIETGLITGADDYLTKPFNVRILSARVKALVRRQSSSYDSVLGVRDIRLDPDKHQVFKNDVEIKLQPKEFAVLEFLLRNRNEPFSVDALLNRVWNSEANASPDTVRVCLTRLRNKIDSPDQPSIIQTVHRLGYKIGDS